MSDDIKVTDGTILEALNGKVDLDGGNFAGSGLEAIVKKNGGGGGLEIGDIGIAPLGIDETKGKRRYLNGQYILQEHFVAFTNKLKNAIAKYPSLSCTESEWQTIATMTVGGQVGKFVVDDNSKTIRLPKIIMPIQGLTDLSKLGEIVEAGLPNITGVVSNTGTVRGFENASGAFWGISENGTPIATGTGTYPLIKALAFDASRSNPIYNNSDTVQQEQIQYPYFIQVATGAETEDNIINEIELNNPFSLLDYKYSEYELNNISWLRSNGQWNPKAVYPAVYELLVKIYNGTETKAGVSVKLSTETYTDYDFVLNTGNTTFRLPIKVKLPNSKGVAGNGMATGYTNGTDNFGMFFGVNSNIIGSKNAYGQNVGDNCSTSSKATYDVRSVGITTDSTKSGIEVKDDSSIYLYFYVGETVQNANLVNIGRIQENMVTRPMVDGQWQKPPATIQLLSTTKYGRYDIDLSNYLPNDGYTYEILISARCISSGNDVYVNVLTSLTSDTPIGYAHNLSKVGTSSSATIPVGTDRKLAFAANTSSTATTLTQATLWLSAYRRLGTNQ